MTGKTPQFDPHDSQKLNLPKPGDDNLFDDPAQRPSRTGTIIMLVILGLILAVALGGCLTLRPRAKLIDRLSTGRTEVTTGKIPSRTWDRVFGGVYRRYLSPVSVIKASGEKFSESDMKVVGGFEDLTELDLSRTDVTDAGVAHLSGLPGLVKLNLAGTKIGDGALEAIGKISSLGELNLDQTSVTDAGLVHLKGLTNLRAISLAGTKITDAGAEVLGGMTQLTSVTLTGTQITGESLKHLAKAAGITALVLENTQVSGEGLAVIKNFAALQYLNLRNTPITDADLVHISGLKSSAPPNQPLIAVMLDGTKITDESVATLKTIRQPLMMTLTQTGVTDEGRKALREHFKQSNIQ